MSTDGPDGAFPVSRSLLAGTGVELDLVREVVGRALTEDLAWGPDVTTEATIPAAARGTAHIVAHAPGTVAGLGVAAAVVEMLCAAGDETAEVHPLIADGNRVSSGDHLMAIRGPLRALLTGERTLLNLLCQLSGVATETARWVQAVRPAPGAGVIDPPCVSVRDTRKTVPGLRVLQKYAVRCGGGVNHRMGLGDAALIKDNHVVACGSITAAYAAVRRSAPAIPIEVECDTVAQVREAIDAGADLILLDNMDARMMQTAVMLARPHAVKLEASGGLTLRRAAEVAGTGVDYVAIGALTHSAPALDLGLDLLD